MGLAPTNRAKPLRTGLVPSRGCGGFSLCTELKVDPSWQEKVAAPVGTISMAITFDGTGGNCGGDNALDGDYIIDSSNWTGAGRCSNYYGLRYSFGSIFPPIAVVRCTWDNSITTTRVWRIHADIFCSGNIIFYKFGLHGDSICMGSWLLKRPLPMSAGQIFEPGVTDIVSDMSTGTVSFEFL